MSGFLIVENKAEVFRHWYEKKPISNNIAHKKYEHIVVNINRLYGERGVTDKQTDWYMYTENKWDTLKKKRKTRVTIDILSFNFSLMLPGRN